MFHRLTTPPTISSHEEVMAILQEGSCKSNEGQETYEKYLALNPDTLQKHVVSWVNGLEACGYIIYHGNVVSEANPDTGEILLVQMWMFPPRDGAPCSDTEPQEFNAAFF